MAIGDERVEYLARRVEMLATQLGGTLRELTAFGADNALLREWVMRVKTHVDELQTAYVGILPMLSGWATRLALLEQRFNDHVEGKPDDSRQWPHDPTPRCECHGDGGGAGDPGGRPGESGDVGSSGSADSAGPTLGGSDQPPTAQGQGDDGPTPPGNPAH